MTEPAQGVPEVAPLPPTPFCPSNAYVQATLGVGSVIFCTVDFGGMFFNSFGFVPSAPWYLGFEMHKVHILCQGIAKRAFVACFASWFSEQYIMSTRVSRKLRRGSNIVVQATLGIGSVDFWSFTVAWTGAGGGYSPSTSHPQLKKPLAACTCQVRVSGCVS